MPNPDKPLRTTLARRSLLALALGALALAGCQSERDRALEERIAAAEAKAAAAEKRAAAAEAAAGKTSPVTVGTMDDSSDADADPDAPAEDQPAEPDQPQQESDAQPEADFAPDGESPQLVSQPPPPQGIPGPVDVGTVPIAS